MAPRAHSIIMATAGLLAGCTSVPSWQASRQLAGPEPIAKAVSRHAAGPLIDHRRAIHNPHPERNIVNHPGGLRSAEMPERPDTPQLDQPRNQPGWGQHQWFGASIKPMTVQSLTLYAEQEVQPELALPPPATGNLLRTLYAPTLMAPGACPLEAVTTYSKTVDDPETRRFFGVWDHVLDGTDTDHHFTYAEPIDQTFLASYTYTHADDPSKHYYEVEITLDGEHSQVLLHNVQTGQWEVKFEESALRPNGRTTGWNIFETYGLEDAPSLPAIGTASTVMAVVAGAPPVPLDASCSSMFDGAATHLPYSTHMVTPNSVWWVGVNAAATGS